MINRIWDRFKSKRLDDPIFGKLLFTAAKNSDSSYWQGCGTFQPLGADIVYSIAADDVGPREAQRELYRKIGLNFDQLFKIIAPLLRREYEASIGTACPPDITDAFHLDSLTIPRKESDDMEWEMSFSCNDSEDWLFTAPIKGWQPTGHIEVTH